MKFPCYKQYDSKQCAITCLRMICKYYGKSLSLEHISKFCNTSSEGASLLGISEGAKGLGMKTLATKISLVQLFTVTSPCILHWDQSHFVVLYKITKGKKFHIADPARGKRIYNIIDFSHHWISTIVEGEEKGIALLIKPTSDFKAIQEDKISSFHSFRFLWDYVLEYRKFFFQIFIGLMLGSLLQLIMPFLTQGIVDLGIHHKDINLIWMILLGELMIVTGRTATDFIRRWLLLHISMRINISLISDFFIKLLKLPMSFFEAKMTGDLLQRMGDHTRIQSFLTNQVLSIMFSILNFFVFGIVLFIYNKLIFSVFVFGSFLYGLWIVHFLGQRRVLDYDLFEQQAINQNKTYQFITSMQEIKLQDCEKRRRWEWEDTQADLFYVQMKSLKLQQTQEAGSIFINELKNIIITVLAATAVINGQITLGAMLAIQYIVGQLNSPVEQMMSFIYYLQDVKLSLERIIEIHNSKNEESEINQIKNFNSCKNITIRNIDFKYDPHALKKNLEGITFDIPAGKVTAIVGTSGSGKTTLIKLLLGYYKVISGMINIAGENINKYNLKWWRQHCGVVMQDGVIFSESIARNIAVSDESIDIERLEKAASMACIHDFIMSLPLKYNTQIGHDGIGLSQGQKQRILIARAIYKNPDFIFLDEATNSLDAKNERKIVENLAKFYNGRTVVIVAHRLSTVKNADQIIVIDNGHIVEKGTHSTLIDKRGAYYNLVKDQLELGN